MEAKITAFIDGLIKYDYILFGGVFILFILLIIFAILLRKKTFLAVMLLILSFLVLILGPTFGYIKMHRFLFKNSVVMSSQKKLQFTQAVVIKGNITNESKFDFESCKITAKAHKVSSNILKKHIYKFKTIQKMSILESDIMKGETRDFKMIMEPFTYSKDYNITLGAECK